MKQASTAAPTVPMYFSSSASFRSWLEKNHASSQELWVGFHKKSTGKPSMTWPESVDVALCFGWIDGLRKNVDASSYKIRFTPRKPRSNWSAINRRRVQELTQLGLMQPAGLKAFELAGEQDPYSYEQRMSAALTGEQERLFRANRKAWVFFQGQTPSYRRMAVCWVISAKKEETRQRRLLALIQDSENGRPIKPLAIGRS